MIEKSFIESEKVFRELFDNMSSGVAVYKPIKDGNDFIIKDLNKAGEEISQVNQKEVVGKLVTKIFPGIKDLGLFEVFQRVWRSGKSENHPISQYKDERISQWVENYVYKLPSGLIVAIYKDVSDKKKAEEALKESEERFRKVFEESSLGMTIIDLKNNHITMANSMMVNMFGYTMKELLNLNIQDITHSEDLEKENRLKEKLIRGEIPFFALEQRFFKKNKKILWGNLTASIIRGNDGKPLYGIGMIADITDHKMAENKLKESEDKLKKLNKELEQRIEVRAKELRDSEIKYRALFEQAGDMIIVLDTENGKIVDFNDKMHENLGYTREEFNNIRVPDFDMMEGNDEYRAHLERIVKQGFDVFESKYKTKSGEVRDILIHAKAIIINKKTYLHSILRDITDPKEMDNKLKESEEKYRKAYYQANLYRDIFAHDINNILQNINSSAELSSLYLNNPEKLHTISELYEIINEQVERGRKLIKNVRKINEIEESGVELEKIEAIKFLKNAETFLKNSFQARIVDVKINKPENKVFVMANNLLLDVFENILINAVRHNISTKIEIIIEINREIIEEKNYIRMEFKDNGLGISDYRKKSIFEKGTRKSQKSKGMGLGLSLVKKIIDSYIGDIWVEDRVKGEYKQGSNFVLLLQEF